MKLNRFIIRPFVEQALREELGPGDTTGGFLFDPDDTASGVIYAKKPFVVCGLPLAEETIRTLDPEAELIHEVQEGQTVEPGQVLLRIRARAWALVAAERCALDWIQYLSGIATRTRHFVKLVEPYGTRLTDTRKGVPGIRVLQKYAVRVGGANNHLFGLHNCVLVKDNHIKIAGSITKAVQILREQAQHTFKIEVECETLGAGRGGAERRRRHHHVRQHDARHDAGRREAGEQTGRHRSVGRSAGRHHRSDCADGGRCHLRRRNYPYRPRDGLQS